MFIPEIFLMISYSEHNTIDDNRKSISRISQISILVSKEKKRFQRDYGKTPKLIPSTCFT
jgi:hypothetical protein